MTLGALILTPLLALGALIVTQLLTLRALILSPSPRAMSNKPMNLSDKVKLFPLQDEGQYQWGAYVNVSSSEYVGMIVGKGGKTRLSPGFKSKSQIFLLHSCYFNQ